MASDTESKGDLAANIRDLLCTMLKAMNLV